MTWTHPSPSPWRRRRSRSGTSSPTCAIPAGSRRRTCEAEWLDGATGPALGAKFRGHVKRNEIGPVYWTTCRVTACEPGREFGFEVLVGDRAVNNWHYRFDPVDGGTDVTESFRMNEGLFTTLFGLLRRSASTTAQHPRHAQDAGADQGRRRSRCRLVEPDAEDRDPEAEQPDAPLAESVVPHRVGLVAPVVDRLRRRAAVPVHRRRRTPAPRRGAPTVVPPLGVWLMNCAGAVPVSSRPPLSGPRRSAAGSRRVRARCSV